MPFLKYCSQVITLYAYNLIFRDVKLENILIKHTKYGLVIKLADFGESCLSNSKGLMDDFCGTLQFMAPEIINCQQYTSKCDLWSLGICAFALLTGKYLFDGDDEE